VPRYVKDVDAIITSVVRMARLRVHLHVAAASCDRIDGSRYSGRSTSTRQSVVHRNYKAYARSSKDGSFFAWNRLDFDAA
jgi:hypothetical protein